jgi:hypothetical protein
MGFLTLRRDERSVNGQCNQYVVSNVKEGPLQGAQAAKAIGTVRRRQRCSPTRRTWRWTRLEM